MSRQDRDCRELCAREQWNPVKVYVENDTSAFKRKIVLGHDGRTVLRTRRPGLREALDDLGSGAIKGLVVYDLDRYTRDPRDLEDLIDVTESTKYPVRSVTGSLRLDTDADVTMARVMVAMANKSSRDTARRVKRAAQQRADKGEWHGGTPPFGMVPVTEVIKGHERVVDLLPHPVHAAWVNEAIDRLLAGETLYGICTDWNAKGRTTGHQGWVKDEHGKRVGRTEEESRWYPRTLKRVVQSPTIAGYRQLDEKLFDAQWDAIVDRDDWLRVREILNEPGRKQRGWSSGNARKYALSGHVFCGGTMPDGSPCGQVMSSMTKNKKIKGELTNAKAFRCSKISTGGCGSMRIEMGRLEEYIAELAFFVANDIRAATPKDDPSNEKLKALRKAIAEDEGRLVQLADEKDDGLIVEHEYRRRRQRIEQRLQSNRRELSASSRVPVEVPSGADLRTLWPHKDAVWKRTILSAMVERITIAKFPEGMASNLTPRRGEDPEGFKQRLSRHHAAILQARVQVKWRV